MSSYIIDIRPNRIIKSMSIKKKDILVNIGIITASGIIGYLTYNQFTNQVVSVGNFGNLDASGAKILDVIRNIAYWVILGKGSFDAIKNFIAGDLHGSGKVVLIAGLCYGTLFFLPMFLRLFENMF